MSSETLNLLTTPIYTGAEDSTLAGLWRKILNDLQIPDEAIADRIDSYAEKVTKNFPEKLSQIRGNLRIDVTKAAMTHSMHPYIIQLLNTLLVCEILAY